MSTPELTDLLLLPGEAAMEAIHDMKVTGSYKRLGALTLRKIVRVGADPLDGSVSISAQLDTGQALTLHFGYHDHPTINARYQILGKERDGLSEPSIDERPDLTEDW